jgi:chromosome transmission fidelity protein 8
MPQFVFPEFRPLFLCSYLKGKPTLRIGHHLLEGKIVSLPKPLAVLQRVCAPPPPPPAPPPPPLDENGDGDVDIQPNDTKDDDKVATSYAIRTLIRKKIVFSKRPTPIVGLSAKMSS